MTFSWKLRGIFLEIAMTLLKNCVKFSQKLPEIYFKIMWNVAKNWIKFFVLCIIAMLGTLAPVYANYKTLTTVKMWMQVAGKGTPL